MALLNFDRITVRYPGAAAVIEDLSLQVSQDDIVVVLGPSGCGKTTLLNLAAGFIHPSAGQVALDGQVITSPGADRGVIFQDDALLPWLNVVDNVALGLQLKGTPRNQRHAIARQVLGLVNLSHAIDRPIWQLSGGMKQRVGLARALAADPQILLMDEPFAALDAFTREQMQELVLNLWQQTHKQVLLITHDIEEAVFLASRLVLMAAHPGRIVQQFDLDFGRRYLAGESSRQIKSDPEFIKTREQVLAWFFAQQQPTIGDLH